VRAQVARLRAHQSAPRRIARSPRGLLPELNFQQRTPGIPAHKFPPAQRPPNIRRNERPPALNWQIVASAPALLQPHLTEQPYFRDRCVAGPFPVCDENDQSAAVRQLTLDEVEDVARNMHEVLAVGETTGDDMTRMYARKGRSRRSRRRLASPCFF
jgi:hypothetical protein